MTALFWEGWNKGALNLISSSDSSSVPFSITFEPGLTINPEIVEEIDPVAPLADEPDVFKYFTLTLSSTLGTLKILPLSNWIVKVVDVKVVKYEFVFVSKISLSAFVHKLVDSG